jgi:Ca-activated chloride channel family protein
MSFLAGWRLAFLALPVLLVAAYLLAQRARQRAVVRFTNVDLLASVAPQRPGWQRHLPAAALIAALAVLVIGFAQPTRAVRVPRQRATIMLVLDVSGSMVADDVSPTRLAAAQEGARNFVNALPPGVQIGLESFSTVPDVLVSPTSDRTSLVSAIDSLDAGGGTATGAALTMALDTLAAVPPAANGKKAPAAIVLMSDGAPTIGANGQSPADSAFSAATAAKQAGVAIDTIAYGTASGTITIEGQVIPVPADPATMARIAELSGGQTFTAASASQLKSVYREIGRAVGYDVRHREITAWFIGLGLALLTAAAAGALIWSQRLV